MKAKKDFGMEEVIARYGNTDCGVFMGGIQN